jgi:uncharacterized membrane protein YeaQ/YmgE (transglycosylase-associated protein family)
MEFLPWVFLTFGAGLIARAIVPRPESFTSWMELILIGTAGTISAAAVRQQILGWTLRPDGWTLLLAIAGAAVFSLILRVAVRRRSGKRLHNWSEAQKPRHPKRAA